MRITCQETAKAYLPFVQAMADGKTVQWHDGDCWREIDKDFHLFGSSPRHLRIKPEPKLRAWKAEEVPVGRALLRSKISNSVGHGLIVAVAYGSEIRYGAWTDNATWRIENLHEALEKFEHSIDGGKTWLPCGVME